MAHQERDAGGNAGPRGLGITQADRGMWQRQAAAMLEHLVRRHACLPALNWYLTWVGNLRGYAGNEVTPGEARTMFAAWSTALGLGDQRELPGPGSLVRAHGRVRWGSVAVSVTASVRPADPGGPVSDVTADQGQAAVPMTRALIPAVEFLARTLRNHPGLDAVTWLVRPSGELQAWVRAEGSSPETGSLFRQWQQALLPAEPRPMAFHDGARTGLHAEGQCSQNVRVTLEATVARIRSHHQAAEPAQPARPSEPPKPDSAVGRAGEHLGAVARRRATRPLQHPPMRGSERHGPTPRPS